MAGAPLTSPPLPVRSCPAGALDLKVWSGGAKTRREGAQLWHPDHPVIGSAFQGPEKGPRDSVDAEIPSEELGQVAQDGPCTG